MQIYVAKSVGRLSFTISTLWCTKKFYTTVEKVNDKPTAAEMLWLPSRWNLLFKQADHQGASCYKSTIPLSVKQTAVNSSADNIKNSFKGIKAANEVGKVSSGWETGLGKKRHMCFFSRKQRINSSSSCD